MAEEQKAAVPEEPYILSVQEMLEADDVEFRTIPAWKIKKNGKEIQGYVRIASLSAEEIAEWRDTADGPAKKTMITRLFVNSLVDKDGKRIGNQSHYIDFKKKSAAIQERVAAEILDLNGLVLKKKGDEPKNA